MCNYMSQVAKMFNVELGERFTVTGIKNYLPNPFYFSESGLHNEEYSDDNFSMVLTKLLNGTAKLKKLPWRPKTGDIFYVPYILKPKYIEYYWIDGNVGVEEAYQNNLVCRTKEEAAAKAEKMIAVLKE